MFKCIIFDLDGVLVDTGNLFYRIHKCILERLNRKPIAFCKKGDPYNSAWQQVLATYPDLRSTLEGPKFEETWDKVLREMLTKGKVCLYSGAMELLNALRRLDRTICLATNTPKKFVMLKLNTLFINWTFNEVFTPQDAWGGKPNPASLFHLMSKYEYSPRELLMIGDLPPDIIYGKNAGVTTVAVHNQYNRISELRGVSPAYIISTLDEVADIVAPQEYKLKKDKGTN